MNNSQLKWILIFIPLFALLGYFREFFFVHYNNVMFQVYYHNTSHLETPSWLRFLFTISYNKLYYFKYPMTILFVGIFFLMNYMAVKVFGSSAKLLKYTVYSYCIICTMAAMSMAYAYFFTRNLADDEYTLSRWLLGVAQSPVICLFLLASEKLILKSSQNE